MKTVLEIKKELAFSDELLGFIETFKTTALAQFQALVARKERFGEFLDSFEGFFEIIELAGVTHPILNPTSTKMGISILTSDMGFMGGLNLMVVNAGLKKEREVPGSELIVIGERGAGYVKDLKKPFSFFPGITTEEQYNQAVKLKDYFMSQIKAGKLGGMCIVYPKPISFMVQHVVVEELSPTKLFLQKRKEEKVKEKKKVKIIIESSVSDIVEYLAGTWITYKLYEVFEDAKISEFAARTVHLEKSYQDLLRQNKELRFEYLKSLHQVVDRNMREIFSARFLEK
jgi:ATP synthase F1 gamma subunit